MIKWASNYFSGISPVFLDGMLYVMLAVTSVNAAMMSSDNAAKYISPMVLFYAMWINGAIDAALLALKLFRSSSFADHKQAQKDKAGQTQFLTKTFQTPTDK